MKSDWLVTWKSLKDKLLNTDEILTEDELNCLKKMIDELKINIDDSQYDLMNLGRIIDYNKLKLKGKNKQEIAKYFIEDDNTLKTFTKNFEKTIGEDHSQMFGYPANMENDSYLILYLRWLESKLYFMNSCGDAYHPGNYRMNNSDIEIQIIEQIKENLNLPKDRYWGYINSGGTEGNFWGIREGVTKYNNGIVYYSDSAHYSVPKFINMMANVRGEKITSILGKIDVKELIDKIENNYKETKSPAILLLTCGTTTLGSIDDVVEIKQKLLELQIPHYIHLDAAMYGGIPKNQINSPVSDLLSQIPTLDLDSLSISLHKYIGNHRVNGVTIAKSQSNQNYIDYIGQRDVTFLGSRDFSPYSTFQRIREMNNRRSDDDYCRNVKVFEDLLKENGIDFIKGNKNGNTFVIEKPCDEICKKYQLATFKFLDKECAHIIIFPYHTLENMNNLVFDIKNNKGKIKCKK